MDKQKMKNELLILNATAQLGFAVILGWIMSLFYAFRSTQVLIFKSQTKLTKAHIDFLMMSMLQYALSAALSELPSFIVLPFVISSWSGPSMFIVSSISIGAERRIGYQAISVVGFILMTYSVYHLIWFVFNSA